MAHGHTESPGGWGDGDSDTPVAKDESILRQSIDAANSGLRTAASKVKESAVLADATHQAESLSDLGKQRLAEYARAVGSVLAQGSHSLKETGLSGFGDGAGAMERAGVEVDRFANTLNSRSSRDLFADAETLARSHPLWFMGAAFAAGFGVGRVLKNAAPAATDGGTSQTEAPSTADNGDQNGGVGHVQ